MLETGSPLFPPDFEVTYRILIPEKGLPLQGYFKSDWSYIDDKVEKTGVWAIYPEFEDAEGKVIPHGCSALAQGTARMFILNPEMRQEVHRNRIKLGVKGFFIYGRTKVAEATVIKAIGLNTNQPK